MHKNIKIQSLAALGIIITLFLLFFTAGPNSGSALKEFYVSPTGSSFGDGSISRPWDLKTALRHPSAIKPGDTINLRGGKYQGKYEVRLRGAPDRPITVRSNPGEWAVIDSGAGAPNRANIIQVFPQAGYLIFRDFEIMSSYPVRQTSIQGSYPDDIRQGEGIAVHAPNVKLINLIVHDANLGISAWQDALDTEIYGNLVYNNGWQGPKEGGSGHGMYIQNTAGVKLIADNIVTSQFGKGIQAYTSQENNMRNITMEGNTIFFNGALSNHPKGADHIIVQGGNPENIVIRNNYMYSDALNTGVVTLSGEGGDDVVFVDNIALNTILRIYDWAKATVAGNTFARKAMTETEIFIRPNKYESGRANLTIYNPKKLSQVSVDISGIGLVPGDAYELHNSQDYFGDVIRSAYNGSPIMVPMTGHTVAPPIGDYNIVAPSSFPDFGSFIVRKGMAGVTAPKAFYNFGITTLRLGSRGPAVMELQRFLNNKLNLGLVVDGILGPKTIAVIKEWQRTHGLVPDGLVGQKTKAAMLAEA